MPKYHSDAERMMVEKAKENGWIEGDRNSQTHITMHHPSGVKYFLPRHAKNKHVLKRVERQMKGIVNKYAVV